MTFALQREIVYPDSDGKPMADNTKQFVDDESVFVAGDLLWYPVEGRPDIYVAPDVLVAFSRPKGDRGSYKQWQERQIAPQVVFEIVSPGNTTKEMSRKLLFYNHYGVEEYYMYDPDSNELTGLERLEGELTSIEMMDGWVSPRFGIRFELTPSTLNLYDRQGKVFLNPVQLRQKAEQEAQRAEQEKSRAERESPRCPSEQY